MVFNEAVYSLALHFCLILLRKKTSGVDKRTKGREE